jgi:hypothetical protein
MKRKIWLHFLIVCLSFIFLALLAGFPQDRMDDEAFFTPDHTSPFRLVSDVLSWPSRTDMDAVAAEISRINSMDPNDIRSPDVIRLFENVPRELVRKLATQGIEYKCETIALDRRTSALVFTIQRQMIRTSWDNLSQRLKAELTVLDYGNKIGGD